jgi:hypothetical protein
MTGAPDSANGAPEENAVVNKEDAALSEERWLRKFRLERAKVWLTLIGIAIPVWIAAYQIRYERIAQEELGQLQFRIAAAQLVMDAGSPKQIAGKARLLKALVPEDLVTFRVDFEADSFELGGSLQRRHDLLVLLAQNPTNRAAILDDYRRLFDWDEWADSLQMRFTPTAPARGMVR